MKYSLLIGLVLAISTSFGQRVVDVDKTDSPISNVFYTVGGEPVSIAKYVRVVEGSPFFSDNWLWGSLTLPGGRKYDTILLRLDLSANEVQYMDNQGNPLIATSPVAEIWLTDTNQNKIHFVHSSAITASNPPAVGWYQLLVGGKVSLLKGFTKEITEVARYSTGVRDQTINTKTTYYLLNEGKLYEIKKIGAIPDLLTEKKADLEKYISANRLNSKSDGSFISLVSYYNSIVTK